MSFTFRVSNREVIVDERDAHLLLEGRRWTVRKSGHQTYVQRCLFVQGRYVGYESLHRVITVCPEGMVVDHKNGNGLDNRRENLRVCTEQQNRYNRRIHANNSCGLKGVYADRKQQNIRWRAQINAGGKKINLGSFDTPQEAHEAYSKAAVKLHGEFARAA